MLSTASRHLPLRLAQRGIVLLLCLTLGMHWALLQGIAWTGMFVAFASEGSVIEAVEKTFDGQHACKLCLKVKEGSHDSGSKQSQQTDDSLKALGAVLVSHAVLVPPTGKKMSFALLREALTGRNEMPETPPPRRGLV